MASGGGGSGRRPLLGGTKSESEDEAARRNMRSEYRAGIAVAIIIALLVATILASVFGTGSTAKDEKIASLQTSVLHLETELMGLLMTRASIETRYMQNGTCVFGFPTVEDSAPQSVAGMSDYVVLNYTLKEVLLAGSVPLTVLEISATPRPIVFPGYTPPPAANDNDMSPQLAFFDPPVATLDALGENFDILSYSYTVASRIVLTPNCVAMSLSEHDSGHCTEENAFSPFYSGSYPTPNALRIFPNNLHTPGHGTLQFTWGQWDYSSLVNQYDFIGTSIEFSAPIQLTLPNV